MDEGPETGGADEQLVELGADGVEEAGVGVEDVGDRVGDPVEEAVVVDEGAGVELTDVEGRVVEEAGLRVGGGEDLEAAVEEEAVDLIGADAAAHAVGGLEEDEGDSGRVQEGSGSKAG